MSLVAAALFAFGMILASFMGVVAVRLNTGQSYLSGRSKCDACGAPLTPSALIPTVSYFLSGGRTRCCGVRLSIHAPLTELLLGTFFFVAYTKLGFIPALLPVLLALSFMLALVLYDLSHQILPPALLTLFILSAAMACFLLDGSARAMVPTLFAALGAALVLLLIHVFSRGRAMGFADIPFVFGLALFAGADATFPGFIFSFWIGAVIGIVILLKRPAGSRMGVEVPFAPYLAAGFLLAYFTQWNPFF
jgi:prepilin signal peptidase PulO-like enzyme (type II secretory pathway)